MPRWLARTLIGVASFIAALCAAAVAFLLFVPSIDLSAVPGDLVGFASGEPVGKMGGYFLAAVLQFAKFAAPFALIAAVLGELKGYRSWLYYTVCGTVLALLGYYIWQQSQIVPPTDEVNWLVHAAYAIAGAVGGLVYWLLAGRSAGVHTLLGSRPGHNYQSTSSSSRPSGGKPTSDRDGKNKSASLRS